MGIIEGVAHIFEVDASKKELMESAIEYIKLAKEVKELFEYSEGLEFFNTAAFILKKAAKSAGYKMAVGHAAIAYFSKHSPLV